MSKPIFVINGPNLNLLGTREPEVYGAQTLADIETLCTEAAKALGHNVINPAAYTHTSVALHDALKAVALPSIEIHLSQPAKRESFRRRSYVAEAVHGTISGFGADSYVLGLQALSNLPNSSRNSCHFWKTPA